MESPNLPPPLFLAPRQRSAHKGDFGRVLIVGGSRGMAGAAALSGSSALHSGAGLVSVAVPDRCLETVAGVHPALMTIPLPEDRAGRFGWRAAESLRASKTRFDAIAIGPGMGTGGGAARMLRWFLALPSPRVLDADGLNLLAMLEGWQDKVAGPLILTPHPGEWERLTGISSRDRQGQEEEARRAARRTGVVIILKGAGTLVTGGEDDFRNPTGNPGMASAGSGDCLTGILAALLAQRFSPWEAARLGVWLHGRAGDWAARARGEAGMTAVDLIEHLPRALAEATERLCSNGPGKPIIEGL